MQIKQQQASLNFQVLPTSRGPLIVHQGLAVQPNTLDHLYSHIKIQHRPISARVRAHNDSFHSSQSWDGAAHFRPSAIRVGANRGDNPGLGRHYNPTRQRHQRNANNSHSRGRNNISRRSMEDELSNSRRVEMNVTNVDGPSTLNTQGNISKID